MHNCDCFPKTAKMFHPDKFFHFVCRKFLYPFCLTEDFKYRRSITALRIVKLGMFRAFKSFKKCRNFSNVGWGFYPNEIFGEKENFRLSINNRANQSSSGFFEKHVGR